MRIQVAEPDWLRHSEDRWMDLIGGEQSIACEELRGRLAHDPIVHTRSEAWSWHWHCYPSAQRIWDHPGDELTIVSQGLVWKANEK